MTNVIEIPKVIKGTEKEALVLKRDFYLSSPSF